MDPGIVEDMIRLVREQPCLYDTQDPEYKSASRRHEKWMEIADQLGLPCDTVRSKWKNLRDSYIKFRKASYLDTKTNRKYKKWGRASHLTFLDDHLEKTSTNSNHAGQDESSTSETFAIGPSWSLSKRIKTDKNGEEHSSEEVDTDDEVIDLILTNEPSKNGNVADEKTTEPNWGESEPKNTLKRKPAAEGSQQNEEKLDITDYLFLSYADTFRKLPSRTQVEVKMEMAKLFYRAELNEFEV